MVRKILFVLLLLTIKFTINAQHHFSLKADGGIDKIGRSDFYYPIAAYKKSYFCPSWRFGVSYSYKFNNYFSLGADVLYLSIKGKQVAQNNSSVGQVFTHTFTEELSYISIPFYVTLHKKKFSISLGGTFIKLLKQKVNAKYEDFANNGFITTYSSWSKLIFPNDVGLMAGLNYRIHNHISISVSGYYGLTNILRNETTFYGWDWRIIQLTGGINYYFYISGSKSPGYSSARDMD